MRVEHLDRVAGDRAGRVVVTAREREQVGEREAGLEQAQPGAQDVGVGLGVAGASVALLRDDQPLAHDRVEQRRRHADAGGELVEGRAARRHPPARRPPRPRAGTSAASSSPASRRRITASEKPWRWSSLMRCEPLDVVGAVPGDAALPPGRREQLALLVEADGVDRHLGAPGELLDPDLRLDRGGRGARSHER